MKDYLNITKNPIYVTMKTILFLIPIGIITKTIYVARYGEYVFLLNKESISDNFNIEQSLFTIITYIVLFMLFFKIETYLLPECIFMSKKIKSHVNKNNLDIIFKRRYGFNPFLTFKKEFPDEFIRYDIVVESMSWPMLLIMFLTCANSLIMYLLAIMVFILTIYFGRILLSVLDQYQIK